MQLGLSMKAQKEELRKTLGGPQLKTPSAQDALRKLSGSPQKPSGSPQEALRKPSGSPQGALRFSIQFKG